MSNTDSGGHAGLDVSGASRCECGQYHDVCRRYGHAGSGALDSPDLDETGAVVKRVREEWDRKFGGGMIPFDSSYFDAVAEGATPAEASRAGVARVLDEFVAEVLDVLDGHA